MGSAAKALGQAKQKASAVKTKKMANVTARVIVGTATCGVSAGAREVVDAFDSEIRARKLKGVLVSETGCSGRCDLEPLVQVLRDGEPPVLYYHMDAEKARRIVQQHILNGEAVRDWALS